MVDAAGAQEMDLTEEGEMVPLSPSRTLPKAGPADTPTEEDLDEIDPFTFKPPFTLCDKLLIAFNALWLFPIRLLFILLPAVIVGAIMCFSSTLCEPYDPNNPTPRAKWRRQYADVCTKFLDRVFLFAFGFNWIYYKGRPAKAKDAPIMIMAPHSSFLDVFVVSLYGAPTFVARDDMRNIRLFGSIITKTLRTIYVKRDDADSKMKAAEEIRRRALSGGVWPKVLIFPEGTTTNKKLLLSFKKGAFLPKLPVQPFLIKYGNRLATATWGKSGWDQIFGLFYTLCQFHNSLELEFLDVYRPSEAEREDVELYAKNVQAVISKSLGIPTGIQSVEDNFFMSQAEKLGLPFHSGMILYNRISKEAGVRFSEIRTFLTRFVTIDANKDGWITPEDMAYFLSMPNDTCLQTLFWTTAKASGERLSFKQYLYGFVVRAKPLLKDRTFLKSVFDFFDKDGNGFVSMSDISQVLPVTKLPEVTQEQVRQRKGSLQETPVRLHEDTDNMDFDQFKLMLETNPEYLLIFHEYQNAGFSSPKPPPTLPAAVPSPGTDTQQQRMVMEIAPPPPPPTAAVPSPDTDTQQQRMVIEIAEA